MLKQKPISEFAYLPAKIDRGYANKIVYCNLEHYEINEKMLPQNMKEDFIGGKGFGLKLLWDAVDENTKWDDNDNELIITTGPLSGLTQYPGAGRAILTTLSPLTKLPVDVNVGGYFGPYLKFSGWDGLEIRGKADRDVILFIDGNAGMIRIIDATFVKERDSHILASFLIEKFASSEEDKKSVAILSSGRGAEYANIGTINLAFYDAKRKQVRLRQTGRGGMGTVLRNKRLLAVVVKYNQINNALNHPADLDMVNRLAIKMHKTVARLNQEDSTLSDCGTASIVTLMNENELLPVNNMQYGSHKDAKNIDASILLKKYFKKNMPDGCWYGCSIACTKVVDDFKLKTGPYRGKKVSIDGPEYEILASLGANCGIFQLEAILEMNFYCDTYGIDAASYAMVMAFLMECYERGIINDEFTGDHKLNFGNYRAMLSVLHEMAEGRGLGLIAAIGLEGIKQLLVEEYGEDAGFLDDIAMVQSGLEFGEYMSKESLAQQGSYGLTNKGPQHDQCWMISMDLIQNNLPTLEDKARALKVFPQFRSMFGLFGLCRLPWNHIIPWHDKNKLQMENDPITEQIKDYCNLYEAVTGNKMTLEDMMTASERVSTFQRLFNKRMGKGTSESDIIPYRAMGPVTKNEYLYKQEHYDAQLRNEIKIDPDQYGVEEKIEYLRKYRLQQYQTLMEAVYRLRQWDERGVPTEEKLKKLGLDEPQYLAIIQN